jgi:glycosyltransferase involved in cell wall biosynthesis
MTELSLDRARGQSTRSSDADLLAVRAETAYPLNVASARVRVAGFVSFLRAHSIELSYEPALTEVEYDVLASPGRVVAKSAALGRSSARAVRRRRPERNLLLVHRLRLLNPLPGFDPPRQLDVYDIDDALFVRFRAGVNRRFQWTKQEARRCIECLRRSRLVIAGNPFLASHAQEYARRVEVLPTCVDPSRQPLRAHHEERSVTVGWIGSPTTTPYLNSVLPVFERLNSKRLRAKLVLVGADPAISAPWLEHHRWSLTDEGAQLASFDIGIMPQPDDDWARGKCGYKILQYFAAGVPAVASPVGVAPRMIGTDRGLIAETPDEWYAALDTLIEDPARRRDWGACARNFVEGNYSYQRWAPELAGLLRSVAS